VSTTLQDAAIATEVANGNKFRVAPLKGAGRNKPSYIGTNAFGVQVEVTSSEVEYYMLLFPKTLQFRTEPDGNYDFTLVFRMPAQPSEAREMKEHLRILVVLQLREPFIDSSWSKSPKPTITNPHETKYGSFYIFGVPLEFWLYDSQSGKVVQRLRPDGRYASCLGSKAKSRDVSFPSHSPQDHNGVHNTAGRSNSCI
jgi:hypothetical protein